MVTSLFEHARVSFHGIPCRFLPIISSTVASEPSLEDDLFIINAVYITITAEAKTAMQ